MKDLFMSLKNRKDLSRKLQFIRSKFKRRQDPRKVSPTLKTAFVLRISVDQEETIYKLHYTSDGSKGQESKIQAHAHSKRGFCPCSNSKDYTMR